VNTASPDGDSAFLVCEDEVIHPDVFVAENPATSPVTLFRLTAHAERSVRLALASRPDLREENGPQSRSLEGRSNRNAHASGGLNNAGTFDAAASSSSHNVRRRPVAPAAGS
jgi:hypothetical protein